MHSTLAMAAVLWRAESTELDSSIQLEGMRHKYEAIREVRTQLPHFGVGARYVDMAFLMSTMSTLVFVEVCAFATMKSPTAYLLNVFQIYDDNFEAAELHLRGVHTLFNSYRQRCNLETDFIFCKATTL
ncbi:uncharacterized protein PG998_012263 [Apiospora kogelbergensis]|uniref:uncharacterized protein n=1 Tax=Apiospora kogelbergensis TaxID=1337665 RepID=UPI0031316AB5